MTDEYPTYYSTVISQIKNNGDAVITLPISMCKKHGFRPGDSFYYTLFDTKVVMTPFVRFSRLKREWNKYMRRMEIFDINFEVIRANRVIGKMKPSESKSHTETI